MMCYDQFYDDYEAVTVFLLPVPGKERVIAVLREKKFVKEPHPATQVLVQAVKQKLRVAETYNRSNQLGPVLGWQFDPKGTLMSSTLAKKIGALEAAGGFPLEVRPTDGSAASVKVASHGGNNVSSQIADQLYMSLYDGAALFQSVGLSKSTYEALKAKADAAAVGEASKSKSNTKF